MDLPGEGPYPDRGGPMLEFGLLSCPECGVGLIDAGDELVCPRCGMVDGKQVLGSGAESTRSLLRPGQPLGSFMGSFDTTSKERSSKGISGSGSTFGYLKTISDSASKESGSASECRKLIERVGEKLNLPRGVFVEASGIAKKVLAAAPPRHRTSPAAVSAYSIIAACRVLGVASVSAREVLEAHADQGHPVTSAAIMRLSMDSPFRTQPRGPSDYVVMVLARLSTLERLAARLRRDGIRPTVYINSLRETAVSLLNLVDGTLTGGRRPSALAASAVYSAELVLSNSEGRKRRLTQRDVSACGDAAEYTVREQCACIFAPAVEELAVRRRRVLVLASAM